MGKKAKARAEQKRSESWSKDEREREGEREEKILVTERGKVEQVRDKIWSFKVTYLDLGRLSSGGTKVRALVLLGQESSTMTGGGGVPVGPMGYSTLPVPLVCEEITQTGR